MDRNKMIAEVVQRVGIRLDPNDPVCAVVEFNRLTLEESVDYLLERASPLADRITSAGIEFAAQVAKAAARRISDETDAGRKAVASEAQAARSVAAVAISQVAKSHQSAHAAKWICGGMLLAVSLGSLGFAAGYVCAPSTVNCDRNHR